MFNWIKSKMGISQEKFEPKTVISLFRYSAFIMISFFFLFDGTISSLNRRVFIVFCIGISSLLLNHLYINNLNNTRTVLFLLVIETVFNAFILVPSGGIESPYIWYSLNTILIASIVLGRKTYCWMNLIFYLFNAIWVFNWVLGIQNDVIGILQKESNFLLSLVLITFAIQILAEYNKQIEEKNTNLEAANFKILTANKIIKESINSIMELYQAVHVLASQQDRDTLIHVILKYTKKITKSEHVFFINNNHQDIPKAITCYPIESESNNDLAHKLSQNFNDICALETISPMRLDDRFWMIAPIKCYSMAYGLIGIETPPSEDNCEKIDLKDQLTFLSELGTMAIERYELEQINKELLVNEEQNRIANEIHDGVLQKLFSISCEIFSLNKRLGIIDPKKLKSELSIIQSSINDAMGDLRSTIYGYSWNKEGTNNFLMDIESIVDSAKRCHEVDVDFDLKGNLELLSLEHKKAFFRIISEGVGNSIRHGKAKHISIGIFVSVDDVLLQIDDDGKGFDMNLLQSANKIGIGIKNMNLLAQSLHGDIIMKSFLGKGTKITIRVPLIIRAVHKRGVI